MLLVGAETAAIVLPLVAIVLSIAALRDSRANYERSLTALATITERAALTERTIGAHIEKIVGTILSVTNAMAVSPEVRKAELDRLGEEQHARFRSDTIRSLSEAIK